MSVAYKLAKYKCHKEVHASKIRMISSNLLFLENFPPDAPLEVPYEYIEKHKPKAGGYYVLYEDGYPSFSPPEAFESGYTLIEEGTTP